ncbi:uncharacterized protein LOC111700915 isoform X2 [Eurytemora carolleeae]|uniref:uncharacterized protein LOC111700915 isoform X2 n=1 Tax=Eurytemora carolleeae TaxID=1294199 RepID=UPI000C77F3AA|nr:uncharacterized protein LOC111700915 isoform X2 [Eurytemora carolleeae]|eukprot:XP_023327785.1 uncharacterized protein LOC111700915 isoform X2 [Eurytemora affinis]
MSQLNLVNFSEVFKDAQETGIKSLLDCSPDVNFQFYDEEGVLESSIKCHKLLLSLVSPVFKKQFFGSLASTTEKLELVEIKDFSFEGFTQMMKLIYDTADNMFEKLFYDILDVALLFEILRLADKYQIEDLAALAKTRIATVPLSDENALEVLEVTEQHKDLLNFEEICKAINLRLAITMKSTWTSSADVDSFCNLYKDRVDLVNILISNVYRVTLDGRVTYPRIKIPEVTTSYMLKYIDYQKFLEQSEEEEEESFHDVEFQITDKKSGEESIRAHKILLGLVSPVFKKMFFGFLSRRTDGVEVVKMLCLSCFKLQPNIS